jgi:hypothetical protein
MSAVMKPRAADGGDQDVGLPRHLTQVPRLRVANRDRRVLMQQQHRRGLAHDIAAAHDDGVRAGHGNPAALEDLDDAGRGARGERRTASLQSAGIDGMKSIHILGRVDGVEQSLGVDLGGKRQLNENAVDVVAVVEGVHQVQHVFGGDGIRRRDQVAEEAEIGAGLHLAADIDLRSRHIANQHGCQAWANALCGEPAHILGDFILDCRGDCGSVQNFTHLGLQLYRIVCHRQ